MYAQDQDLQSKVDDKVARMIKELNLTDSQADRVRPIIKEYTAKREEILQGEEGQGIIDHVAIKDTMEGIKKEGISKIESNFKRRSNGEMDREGKFNGNA